MFLMEVLQFSGGVMSLWRCCVSNGVVMFLMEVLCL